MDIKFNTKPLIAIEYPGTVLNVDNMVKTLKSETEMWSTFNNKTRRLELKFRPADPHCKCVYGDRFNSNNLLLKVTKRVKKGSKKADPTYTMEFFGVASSSYRFQSLVDFQVLPITFDEHKGYKSLLPDIVPNNLHSFPWLNQDVDLFISPLLYSRFDYPQGGYMETNKGKSSHLPENIIGRCRKRRAGFTIFLTFENKEVPEKPHEMALKQLQSYPFDSELRPKVEEYFAERPIWSKNALICKTGIEKPRVKYSLPCTAYYFTNGPWRTLWCRFGYDPRKDPSSKILQVMDLRINSNIPLAENKNIKSIPRVRSFANKTLNAQRYASINIDYLIPAAEIEISSEADNQKALYLLCTYIPGEIPPVRQCFYQLCDIHLESVQALVHQNDGQEEICHEKDGWCEPGTIEKCRELIIADIVKTLKEKEESEKNTD